MEGLVKISSIAAGGALGAVARYLVNVSPLAEVFRRFPLATFVINVVGSFLVGFFLIVFTDKIAVSDGVRMGVMVGFLGAFTTFSTFEAEIYGLVRERQFTLSIAYLVVSVVLGFAAVLSGVALGRKI